MKKPRVDLVCVSHNPSRIPKTKINKFSKSSTDRQTLSDDKPQLCRPHESTVSHSLGNHPFIRSDNFAEVTL